VINVSDIFLNFSDTSANGAVGQSSKEHKTSSAVVK